MEFFSGGNSTLAVICIVDCDALVLQRSPTSEYVCASFVCLQDFLGQAFCTLGEIVGSLGGRLEKPLM